MKKILAFFAAMLILLSLSPAVLANPNKVVDEVALLTAQQKEDLASLAQSITDTYNIDVAIVVVSSLEGKTSQDYADDYFDYNGYGIGEDFSGVLFLLATQDRDYTIYTDGKAIDVLSDQDINGLLDCVYSDFRNGNYYQGLRTYLETLEGEFYSHVQGEETKAAKSDDPNYVAVGAISLAVGAGAGGIGLASMRSGMKTAKPQMGAQSYLANNSFALPVNQNTFLYSRTSRTRIQTPTSTGGGIRGSTHRSSSGRSHGGGSRKF